LIEAGFLLSDSVESSLSVSLIEDDEEEEDEEDDDDEDDDDFSQDGRGRRRRFLFGRVRSDDGEGVERWRAGRPSSIRE